ncbi:ribbon-helix-helix domain-containing protein [Clostridium gasigenes]|uniref:Ribbon-helix-helix domain-containing protein n=1 Tax=Clostridium gasigenes TaxID=94869 RepID=A0A1H0VDA1_9CLOT|nr:ribbon-helix-helix domain-containing protein [Clostridium gasigenes]SDP76066.1 Ribbon-helix-helix domain-containing protein [Clostridium gasigenes]
MTSKNKNDLKNRKRYTASFDLKLFDALMTHSKETEVPFSELLDRCLKMYLEENNLIDKE